LGDFSKGTWLGNSIEKLNLGFNFYFFPSEPLLLPQMIKIGYFIRKHKQDWGCITWRGEVCWVAWWLFLQDS
jgi:hypothetical protein